MATPAGRYRHKVTLQAPPDVEGDQNEHGEPTEAWADVFTARAEVVIAPGGETIVGDQLKPTQSATVLLRTRTGINTTKRFKWVDYAANITRYLYITSFTYADNPHNREILCTCKASDHGD